MILYNYTVAWLEVCCLYDLRRWFAKFIYWFWSKKNLSSDKIRERTENLPAVQRSRGCLCHWNKIQQNACRQQERQKAGTSSGHCTVTDYLFKVAISTDRLTDMEHGDRYRQASVGLKYYRKNSEQFLSVTCSSCTSVV